jgi:beta-xylosidase
MTLPAATRRQQLRFGGALALGAAGAVWPGVGMAGWRSWVGKAPRALDVRPVRSVIWAEFLGVNAQLQWFPADVARQQVERLKALGLSWVRLALHWMLIEPEPGRWRLDATDRMMGLVQSAGLHSVAYVVGSPRFASAAPAGADYADKYPPKDPAVYAQRLQLLARRYPQVDVWQVWNEPNIPAFWQPRIDPEGYGRLLQPAVAALRQVSPDKPIAMAGMAYYSQMAGREGLMLDAMGKLGAYQLKLIACYHPYTAEPEGAEDGARDLLTHVPFLNKGLRAYGARQIWATEWGWSSYDGPVEEQPLVGEDGQAGHTLKRLALMATQDFDRVFLFTLADLDDPRVGPRDKRYGLLRANGQPKPVYLALQRFLAICGPRLDPAAPVSIAGGMPPGLVSISWQRPDGKRLWMAWAHEPMSVSLSGVQSGTWHQPLGGTQREVRVEAKSTSSSGLTLDVNTDLQILVWTS